MNYIHVCSEHNECQHKADEILNCPFWGYVHNWVSCESIFYYYDAIERISNLNIFSTRECMGNLTNVTSENFDKLG